MGIIYSKKIINHLARTGWIKFLKSGTAFKSRVSAHGSHIKLKMTLSCSDGYLNKIFMSGMKFAINLEQDTKQIKPNHFVRMGRKT